MPTLFHRPCNILANYRKRNLQRSAHDRLQVIFLFLRTFFFMIASFFPFFFERAVLGADDLSDLWLSGFKLMQAIVRTSFTEELHFVPRSYRSSYLPRPIFCKQLVMSQPPSVREKLRSTVARRRVLCWMLSIKFASIFREFLEGIWNHLPENS